MSSSAQREVSTVAELLGALARDRFVQAAALLLVLFTVLFAVPVLDRETLVIIGDRYGFVVMTGACLLAIGYGWSKIQHVEERRFWMEIFVAFGFWLVVASVKILLSVRLQTPAFRMLWDHLFLCFFAAQILATEEAPHLPSGWTTAHPGHIIGQVGTGLLTLSLLAYFAVVPILWNSKLYATELPSFYLYCALDLFLVVRTVYLVVFATSRRWRVIYRILLIAFVGFMAGDVLDTVVRLRWISLVGGPVWFIFWFVPFGVVVCAARARRLPFREDAQPLGQQSADREFILPRRLHSPLYVYAVTLPAMHSLLYGAGFLDAASRQAREVVVLCTVLSIGSLAIYHQWMLERDRLHLETEVWRKSRQLVQSQKMEAVGRLAGGLAHDLNNLLTVALGHSECLAEALHQDPVLHRRADEIRRIAIKAGSVMGQLLAFGRLQVMHPQVLDLNTLLRGILPMLKRIAGERVVIETRFHDAIGRVQIDAVQFGQAVMNIVENAREAMPQGGRLTILTSNLSIGREGSEQTTAISEGRYVLLAIRDTGRGMSEEVRRRIFEPFFTTKGTSKGTGLGLSSAYGIVTQSGGQILCERHPGGGTVFRIVLPRVEATPAPEPQRAVGAIGGTPLSLDVATPPTSAKVLVIEDEPAVREMMAEVLERAGYQVESAGNGREALGLWERAEGEFDLVVSDVVMPEMGGYDTAQELRRRDVGVRIMFVSGYAERPEERPAVAANAPFLAKPFTSSEFLEKIRLALVSAPAGSASDGMRSPS